MVNIINPSYEIIEEKNIYKKVELCGRLAYKSEEKITEDSHIKFIRKIIRSGHESVIEHGVISLDVDKRVFHGVLSFLRWRNKPNYLKITRSNGKNIITGNIKSFRDLYRDSDGMLDVVNAIIFTIKLKYPIFFEDFNIKLEVNNRFRINIINDDIFISEDDKLVNIYVSVRFICNRGYTHELVRMRRDCAYTQESTRYCNYSMNKYGNQITVIHPIDIENTIDFDMWERSMKHCEVYYLRLLQNGLSPQIARGVLPIDLKTEIIMTTNLLQWKYVFKLRALNKRAHPAMRQLMVPLFKDMKERYPHVFRDMEIDN